MLPRIALARRACGLKKKRGSSNGNCCEQGQEKHARVLSILRRLDKGQDHEMRPVYYCLNQRHHRCHSHQGSDQGGVHGLLTNARGLAETSQRSCRDLAETSQGLCEVYRGLARSRRKFCFWLRRGYLVFVAGHSRHGEVKRR